jgi:hypothetical protein
MDEEFSPTLGDLDFDYEDSPVRVVALTSLQEVTVADTTVGPLEEGKEFEAHYWIAEELVKAGYARFREDEALDYVTLNKLHWRETKLQPGLQISPLPDHFYPKLRRFLSAARERSSAEPVAATHYLQGRRLAQDIINCRLRKIVGLAASPTRATSVMQTLSKEECILFEKVRLAVAEWEKRILDIEAR